MNVFLLVLGGSAAGQTMTVGDRITIGSGPDCTLRLTDAGVEPLHATIELQGERYRLRSTVGVWVGGQPMVEADLASIIHIDVGEATFLFYAAGDFDPETILRAAPSRPLPPPRRMIFQLGDLAQPRTSGALAMVDPDRVLIVGGRPPLVRQVLAVAELFSLSAGKSVEVALTAEREYPIAAPCAAGVLIACGDGESAELFDADAGESRPVAPMHAARRSGAAHTLPDGRVLVLGGHLDGTVIGEIYDAERDDWWALAGPPLRYAQIVDLGDGRLFVLARVATQPLPAYYVLDTATWRFTPVPPPRSPRDNPELVATGDGRVLLMAGISDGLKRTVERFDPATLRFEPVADLLARRSGFAAAPLPRGRVLVAGGRSLREGLYSAEIYDIGANRWQGVALPEGCNPLGAVARGDGSVVLVGVKSVFLAA